MFHSVEIYIDYVLLEYPAIMSDDHRAPNPVQLKKLFTSMKNVYDIKKCFDAIDTFMDHLDFDMKPWDIEDPVTRKSEIYIEDKNILRKVYKLKNIYKKQRTPRPNPQNWNFGSVPPQLQKQSWSFQQKSNQKTL